MSNINNLKSEIRKQISVLKKNFSESEKKKKSSLIFREVVGLEEFKSADIIMAYWSLPDEVQTRDFVLEWYVSKTILLPVVKGNELELRTFKGENQLQISDKFSIHEPTGDAFSDFDKIDLIIVPGVAFDKDNNRLGRGKAYYDRFLKNTNAYKVGVCFDFQMIESVPHDKYDFKMDKVIFA